jgi:multidrug efflux pump subunit AcrA (membrane-fusion protein)
LTISTSCKPGNFRELSNSINPGSAQKHAPEGLRPPDTPVPVYTTRIEERLLDHSFHSPGNVVCLDRFNLSASVGGVVEALTVLPGQKIGRGEVVARIDSSELELEKRRLEIGLEQVRNALQQARFDLRQARVDARRKLIEIERLKLLMAQAERNLKKARDACTGGEALHAAGALSGKAMEESRLELLSAEEEVKDISHRISAALTPVREEAALAGSESSSRTRLTEEEQSRFMEVHSRLAELKVEAVESRLEEQELLIEALRRRIELCAIRSPANGFITEIHTTVGSRLQAGDTVCILIDPSRLFIRTRIPESEAGEIREDMPLKFTRLGGKNSEPGRVLKVFPETDTLSKSVPLLCEPAAPTGHLRPGDYVDVEFELRPPEAVLSLPENTLLQDGPGGSGKIFFIHRGRAFAGDLEVLERRGDIFFFRGDFKAGTEVVLNPPGELRDGTPVSPLPMSPPVPGNQVSGNKK